MSFMTFRNAYLAQAQTRLDAVGLATADDNRLLVAGALYKMAGSVAQFDLLEVEALALLESLDGPSLQAWLADAANAAAFAQVCASSTAMTAVAASSTAMAAVIASSTAMAAVIASSTAMTAVAARSTAMAAVIASSTAMAAVAASSTAMAAVIAAQTALDTIAADPAAWTVFVAATTFPVGESAVMTSDTAPSGVASASTIYSTSYAAYRAMDSSPGTAWWPAAAAPQWLQYEFAAPMFVHTLEFTGATGRGYPTAFTLAYSDDGAVWSTAYSGAATGIAPASFPVAAAGKHAYWRLNILQGSSTLLAVAEFSLKGWV